MIYSSISSKNVEKWKITEYLYHFPDRVHLAFPHGLQNIKYLYYVSLEILFLTNILNKKGFNLVTDQTTVAFHEICQLLSPIALILSLTIGKNQ